MAHFSDRECFVVQRFQGAIAVGTVRTPVMVQGLRDRSEADAWIAQQKARSSRAAAAAVLYFI